MGMLDHPARVKGIYELEPLNIPQGSCRGNFHGPRPAKSDFIMDITVGEGMDTLRMQVHLCRRCRERLVCGGAFPVNPVLRCEKMLGHDEACEWKVCIGSGSIHEPHEVKGKPKGKRR